MLGNDNKTLSGNEQLLKILHESYAFIKKGKYKEAVFLLNKALKSSRVSHPYPNFLYVISLIMSNNFSEAVDFLKRMQQQFPDYEGFYTLDVFLSLKSAVSAEDLLYKIISGNKKNFKIKRINRITDKLKKVKDFENFQKKIRLNDIVDIPSPDKNSLNGNAPIKRRVYFNRIRRRKIPYKAVLVMLSFLVAAAVFYVAYIHFSEGLKRTDDRRKEKPISGFNEEYLSFEENRYPVIDKIVKEKPLFFYAAEDDLKKDYNEAKKKAKAGELNDAMIMINKISNSNANIKIKDKVNFLRSYILGVNDRETSEYYVKEVMKCPELYIGVKMILKGKVANLRVSAERSEFDILLNYTDKGSFDGLASLYGDGITVNDGDICTLDAVLMSILGSEKKLYFKAESLHK